MELVRTHRANVNTTVLGMLPCDARAALLRAYDAMSKADKECLVGYAMDMAELTAAPAAALTLVCA